VIARVGGRSYHSGRSSFVIEENDPLRDGFAVPHTLGELMPQ
jgi:hypothetical protein